MKKVKRVKAWVVLNNDGNIKTDFCTPKQLEIYVSKKSAKQQWVLKIVPCTIEYEVPNARKS
jgi:hypothetical protein